MCAPVHLSIPGLIGISELHSLDYDDSVFVAADKILVFWACSVPPQEVLIDSGVSFAIIHSAGHMLVTDIPDSTLAFVPYPSQMVLCNADIDGLSDLKGMKVRTSGRTTAEFLQALGAEDITLNFSEVPGALQQGVIDCAVTGSLSGYSSGWHEVSTHLYPLPVCGWVHVVTAMNGKRWNSLSEETQEWLTTEIKKNYEDPVWASAVGETKKGIACLTGKGECSRGDAGEMILVEATDSDFTKAVRHLEKPCYPTGPGVLIVNELIAGTTRLAKRPD
jgi:hypothetical protein